MYLLREQEPQPGHSKRKKKPVRESFKPDRPIPRANAKPGDVRHQESAQYRRDYKTNARHGRAARECFRKNQEANETSDQAHSEIHNSREDHASRFPHPWYLPQPVQSEFGEEFDK